MSDLVRSDTINKILKDRDRVTSLFSNINTIKFKKLMNLSLEINDNNMNRCLISYLRENGLECLLPGTKYVGHIPSHGADLIYQDNENPDTPVKIENVEKWI